ncbi:MAG: sugar-binding transcriptional regulator [Deltaproteobacteria bacterium]|nr:sugar-binding transcriptional regulator [Deltaproteobacteria bacterium]
MSERPKLAPGAGDDRRSSADPRELRLLAKAARLYYEKGLSQAEIGAIMDLSQATVSRLLKRALDEKIVRITVSIPGGTCPEIEDQLERRYNMREVIVVDAVGDEADTLKDLGAAAAFYVETTLKPGTVVGISSWSSTLLAMVDAMHPPLRGGGTKVVQILGGVGSPTAEVHATRLTQRLAQLLGGQAVLLPAPGVVASPETRRVLLKDPYIADSLQALEQVEVALVGIGDLEPSKLLAASGNAFSAKELESLQKLGAVGDICLRFFDKEGKAVPSKLDERVIGMSLAQLAKVQRTVGVAAGKRKVPAIAAALRARLVSVLVTDKTTALAILAHDEA